LKLLIVDDNYKMRSIIRSILEDIFDTIHEIDDGDQALDMYESFLPDWMVMDIKMKHVDGITATQIIKSVFPQARIIILTNFPDKELKDAAFKAGASDYVLKDNLIGLRSIITKAVI
jgi:CheY-like chemotaxis protein